MFLKLYVRPNLCTPSVSGDSKKQSPRGIGRIAYDNINVAKLTKKIGAQEALPCLAMFGQIHYSVYILFSQFSILDRGGGAFAKKSDAAKSAYVLYSVLLMVTNQAQ